MKEKHTASSQRFEPKLHEIKRAINKHAAPGCGTHWITLKHARSEMDRDSARSRNPQTKRRGVTRALQD
ncbi:hypothetical protein NDU88_009030 [Pleurodeles waltl]|uniref:Uncharacterized protein n=1 Tax=Pleurodeles waltl TaxID=8319 RepID=A0AAV7PRL6_PLEWA|nr:hypothetical protein NDU88_009030 [Pleurodeles waltl]